MEKHGFKVNSSEWWHYDFVGWKKYEVLDIDFEELVESVAIGASSDTSDFLVFVLPSAKIRPQ